MVEEPPPEHSRSGASGIPLGVRDRSTVSYMDPSDLEDAEGAPGTATSMSVNPSSSSLNLHRFRIARYRSWVQASIELGEGYI